MKNMMAVLLIGLLVAAPALADATAGFVGMNAVSSGNEVWVNAGTDATFDLTFTSGQGGFDSMDAILGANGVTDLTFAYSAAWQAAFDSVTDPSYDWSYYDQDAFISSGNSGSVGASLLAGTVTINTLGLADGDYIVQIDSGVDGFSELKLAGAGEDIYGIGTIHIPVPEPASLSLLAIAGLAGLRRRR